MDSAKETAECAFLHMYMDRLDRLEKENTILQSVLSEYLGPVHTPARDSHVAHVKHYKPSLVTPYDLCLVCCEIVGDSGTKFLDTSQGLSYGDWPAKELFRYLPYEHQAMLYNGAKWSLYRRAGNTLQIAVWTEDSRSASASEHETGSWTAKHCANVFCEHMSHVHQTEDFQFWWLNEADFKLLKCWCDPTTCCKTSKAQQAAMDAARAKIVKRQELGLDIPWIFKVMLDGPNSIPHRLPTHA